MRGFLSKELRRQEWSSETAVASFMSARNRELVEKKIPQTFRILEFSISVNMPFPLCMVNIFPTNL
jgi:hypothetical protein